VWDFDLHLRFLKSSGDAWAGFAAASLAAAAEWQDQTMRTISEHRSEPAAQPAMFNPMMWWTAFLPGQNMESPHRAASADFAMPFFGFQPAVPAWAGAKSWPGFDPLSMMSLAFNPFARAAPATGFGGPDIMTMMTSWPQMLPPYSWTMFQLPMTAMMMASGIPHSVASPAAKASAATLDAIDAARTQAKNVFSAYRSDGGHASAQILNWPFMAMMSVVPWVAPYMASMHS
jgi:hypothetical protein